MIINKKFLVRVLLALVAMGFATSAFATRERVTGVPVSLMSNGTSSAYADSFDVSGVTSMGTCPTDTNGFVVASIPALGTGTSANPSGSRLWTLALAAEQAGKPVTVLLDDTLKDSAGNCVAIWMYM